MIWQLPVMMDFAPVRLSIRNIHFDPWKATEKLLSQNGEGTLVPAFNLTP